MFSNFHCRFIDDIFLLWNVSKTQLLKFIKRLNSRYPIIKFDFKYSQSSTEFLDTKICKKKGNNKSLTTIYRKPTDRRYFLYPNWAHPKWFINSINYFAVVICFRHSLRWPLPLAVESLNKQQKHNRNNYIWQPNILL